MALNQIYFKEDVKFEYMVYLQFFSSYICIIKLILKSTLNVLVLIALLSCSPVHCS